MKEKQLGFVRPIPDKVNKEANEYVTIDRFQTIQ